MPHSHLTVNHLLRQLDEYLERKSERDMRPEWLTELIDNVADLFDPLTDIGRVGFDCRMTEEGWDVAMYLGSREFVGGAHDGRIAATDFRLNVIELTQLFVSVEEIQFEAVPSKLAGQELAPMAEVSVRGHGPENTPLTLRVLAAPPEYACPGLRQFPNGELEEN
ncbi:hypothetical protein [Calycomorphotria hydatis]|uniref:Uncharacterized protein n=1 Tax=Calycomorphotria hydatis TaxID=2528027 RepID=A0A517T833_9PLAN|nr:hypothetical protein [Calycomorphotria hydatis]QDT64533.1 hypothetical protein V22_17680 [Calycomorphotria hydatis]